VISSFLSTGASTETVPIKVYSGARTGATPAVNAIATVMLVFTLAAVALAALAMKFTRRHSPDDAGATLTGVSI
jgi:spermidine/putrescine transport system permease protein